VLVHNHLSGDPTLSQADIAGPLGISVHDDIVRPQERACKHEGAEADLG